MKEKYISNSLLKGLEAFSVSREVLTQGDISEILGITTSAAYRVITTLEYAGFIQKIRGKRGYRLSPKVMDLGFSYLESLDFIDMARPYQ